MNLAQKAEKDYNSMLPVKISMVEFYDLVQNNLDVQKKKKENKDYTI